MNRQFTPAEISEAVAAWSARELDSYDYEIGYDYERVKAMAATLHVRATFDAIVGMPPDLGGAIAALAIAIESAFRAGYELGAVEENGAVALPPPPERAV